MTRRVRPCGAWDWRALHCECTTRAFHTHPASTGTPLIPPHRPPGLVGFCLSKKMPRDGCHRPGRGPTVEESNMHNRTSGMRSERISQRMLLEAFQQDEQFVYALITNENAVKIGVSVNLASRKSGIRFGGTKHFIGFRPGGYPEERRLHRSLAEFRIPGTNEYYYPVPGVLPVVNEMRDWMGIRPMRRRELPRPASCTFHRRVMDAQVSGQSVFKCA